MRVLSMVLGLTLCVACGSSTGPVKGAAHFAIVSGNHQTAVAKAATLGQPVQGQLYRQADGSLAFRILDAALPAKAFAQTTVQGGIPGAVTCWADVADHPRLIPFSQCVNTDANGMVTYNLHPDSLAGSAQGEVHWDSSGVALVTATVSATVLPGAASAKFCMQGSLRPQPYVVGDTAAADAYGNVVPFRLVGDSNIIAHHDTLTWNHDALIVGGKPFVDSLAMTDTLGVTIGHMQYTVGAGTDQLSWKSYGLSILTNAGNQAPNCTATHIS